MHPRSHRSAARHVCFWSDQPLSRGLDHAQRSSWRCRRSADGAAQSAVEPAPNDANASVRATASHALRHRLSGDNLADTELSCESDLSTEHTQTIDVYHNDDRKFAAAKLAIDGEQHVGSKRRYRNDSDASAAIVVTHTFDAGYTCRADGHRGPAAVPAIVARNTAVELGVTPTRF